MGQKETLPRRFDGPLCAKADIGPGFLSIVMGWLSEDDGA